MRQHGGKKNAEHITTSSAAAFFAALDPNVWDALPSAEQRRWLHELWEVHAYLAVRSLGLRPDILARSETNDNLALAAKRQARDAAALRWALFPVALRSISSDEAHALMSALPTPPPDLSAFFVIASGHADPSVITVAHTTLQTPADLACAVALQRSVVHHEKICARSNALRAALRGRRWDDLAPILALLDADARAALLPDSDALIASLARPDRREEMRAALSQLASLPPEVDIPVRFTLNRWQMVRDDPYVVRDVAKAIAHALQSYGDVFLMLKESIVDDALRAALLPLPTHEASADALRALACDDPPTAHALAHALCNRDWRAATETVLQLPAHHRPVWTPATDALVARFAHPDQREALRHALDRLTSLPPDVDLLVRFALDMGNRKPSAAAEDIALALRVYGDVFLAIIDALADERLRTALLPPPEDTALADALRNLARDDPPFAQRLAYTLCDGDWRAKLYMLLKTSSHHANAVWLALDDAARNEMVAGVNAAPFGIDPIIANNPIIALALAAAQANNDDLRDAGVAALSERLDVLRVMWDNLPQETQHSLREHPAIAVGVADITARVPSPTACRGRIR